LFKNSNSIYRIDADGGHDVVHCDRGIAAIEFHVDTVGTTECDALQCISRCAILSWQARPYGGGHTVAFFLLTGCAVLVSGYRTSRLIMLLALILLFSMMTELSQLLVDGRNPKFKDLVFDLIGVMAALLIFYFPRFLALRRT